ncbi:unnamed protein product, partial [Prorocentrum cordatum]
MEIAQGVQEGLASPLLMDSGAAHAEYRDEEDTSTASWDRVTMQPDGVAQLALETGRARNHGASDIARRHAAMPRPSVTMTVQEFNDAHADFTARLRDLENHGKVAAGIVVFFLCVFLILHTISFRHMWETDLQIGAEDRILGSTNDLIRGASDRFVSKYAFNSLRDQMDKLAERVAHMEDQFGNTRDKFVTKDSSYKMESILKDKISGLRLELSDVSVRLEEMSPKSE